MTPPLGWAQTTLGDCQGRTRSVDPRDYPDEEFDLYSVPSYSNYSPDIVLGNEIGSTKQEVRSGDVLLCKIVPHIRRAWIVPPRSGNRKIASGEWIVFRDYGLEPEYLRQFLLSDAFHEQLMRTVSGVGGSLMRARPSEVSKIAVPVPPTAEQRRIVMKLDTLTARLARARTELDKAPALAQRLREAVLSKEIEARFGQRISLSTVLQDIRYGTSKKCDYGGGATPVLRIPNIQGGRIDLADLKSANFNERELSNLALIAGDVLVIRSNGSLDLVGRSAVVGAAASGMLFAGYLIRLRADPERLRPSYLQYFLSAPQTRAAIELLARSTSGVNNINSQQLRALELQLPSASEQDAAVLSLNATFAHADRLESEAARALALLDILESAILTKAFRGELVSQDPNDEPASILLARTRVKREAQSKSPQRPHRPSSKDHAMTEKPLSARERLLKDSAHWPQNGLPFAEVAKRVTLSHDEMRDALFDLLGGLTPLLRQQFDKQRKLMVIQRNVT